MTGVQPLAPLRAVRRNDTVQRRIDQYIGHAIDRLICQIGRNLKHHGPVLVLPAPELEQRFQNVQDIFAVVRQILPAGVVATEVDGEIIHILVEVAEDFQIVRRSLLGRRRGIPTDIASDNQPLVRTAQVLDGLFQSAVGCPYAADDGAVFRQPENAGTRISLLRTGRHGAHLDESESHGPPFAAHLAVGVETGANPTGLANLRPNTSRSSAG